MPRRKPATLDFLGFTRSCGPKCRSLASRLKWKPMKKMRARLQVVKERLKKIRHASIRKQGSGWGGSEEPSLPRPTQMGPEFSVLATSRTHRSRPDTPHPKLRLPAGEAFVRVIDCFSTGDVPVFSKMTRRTSKASTRSKYRPRSQSEHCVSSRYSLPRQRPTWAARPLNARGAVPCHAPVRGRRPGYSLLCPWSGVWERPCVRRSCFRF